MSGTASQDAWWSLPGPCRFLDRLVGAANASFGVLGLSLPRPAPPGWLEAVTRRVDEQASSMPTAVDVSAGLRGRSPVRILAAAAGLETSGLRLIPQFVDEPALIDAVFLVHGVPASDWRQWSLFLRSFRAERQRTDRAGAPVILFDVPPSVPPDDVRATLDAAPLRWMGVLSRLDTRLFIERLAGRQDDDLTARVAMETTVELASWDRTMAEALTRLPLKEQLDPLPFLADYAASLRGQTPCWENGLVDLWDGQPHVSTLALLAAGDQVALRARLWSARVRAIFPFLNAVRLAYAIKYGVQLRAALPITKTYNERQQIYDDPFKLELFDIKAILESVLSSEETLLLGDCLSLRRAMAHSDPGGTFRIIRMSERWERLEPDFPTASVGWDWPRCGQSLVMMVGPSGAGKSTYAADHYDGAEIVSSDAIRGDLFGGLDVLGDQGPVFERLRADVRQRLAVGRRVVVDATHIKTADRLSTARLAPADIPVEYVVIDRLMDEKVATAGWRAQRPSLLTTHAATFAANREAVLAGDGLPNVTVTVPPLDGRNVALQPTVAPHDVRSAA